MKFPAYWTRVTNESGSIVARGWSETSQDEAQLNAENRLQRITNALENGSPIDHYRYVADHVICEEVIDRIYDNDSEIAVISRNAYGSLIMNTPLLLFADIDITPPQSHSFLLNKLLQWIASKLLTPPLNPKEKLANIEENHLAILRQWQADNHQYSLRVYRTFAGLRVMVSNHVFATIDDRVLAILRSWQSDPRFEQLCKVQQCFRARLSPKPWRVQMDAAPAKFPFKNPEEEDAFQKWFDRYVTKCQRYRVCQFVETIGSGEIEPTLLQLIEQHDAQCGVTSDLPLA